MNDLDPRLDAWVQELKGGFQARPEAVARVREAFRSSERGALSAPLLLGPAVLAVPALVITAAVVWFIWSSPSWPVEDVYPPPTLAHFVIQLPHAQDVALVGDFNDWDPTATPLERSDGGLWSVLVPLPPGSVRYSYLVDGTEWRSDPHEAPAGNDFGRPTSIAFISAPEDGG